MSAFILLFIGVIIAVVLLLMEWCYFKYFRKFLGNCTTWIFCCNLLSIDLAESIKKTSIECVILISLSIITNLQWQPFLHFYRQNRLQKPTTLVKENKSCINPICDLSIKSVTQDLQEATQRIRFLQSQLDQLHYNRRNLPRSTSRGACLQNVSEIETVL